nr:GNAT family protein [uncultured Cohaesibacter sp.]
MKIALRPIKLEDLPQYRKLIAPTQAFHRLNGPYLGMPTAADQNKKIMEFGFELTKPNPSFNFELIFEEEDGRILGEVSYYWKDQRTNWLEVGIVLFNQTDWGRGIGTVALPLWIDRQLTERPALVRIGLTTWSGNAGMMALAERIGLKLEACYRKARILDGKYFDSLSYGILREDWNQLRTQPASNASRDHTQRRR